MTRAITRVTSWGGGGSEKSVDRDLTLALEMPRVVRVASGEPLRRHAGERLEGRTCKRVIERSAGSPSANEARPIDDAGVVNAARSGSREEPTLNETRRMGLSEAA